METSSAGTSFRLFITAWFSMSGLILFFFIALPEIGFSEGNTKNVMVLTPIILLPTLIYSYVENKNPFFKWFCYALIGIGTPTLVFSFASLLFMSDN